MITNTLQNMQLKSLPLRSSFGRGNLLTDGSVQIELLGGNGESSIEALSEGSLFVVPTERQREHPFSEGGA